MHMSTIVITGTALLTSAGIGPERLLDAMAAGDNFFNNDLGDGDGDGVPPPWPVAALRWSDIGWPVGEIWQNNKKYAGTAARGAVAVANMAIEMCGRAGEEDGLRAGTVLAIGSACADEISATMQQMAVMQETDSRPLATLLYDEVADFSYIRGIPSQIGQFVSMATGFRASNVVVFGESGAGGLNALSLAARLIDSGELDRVVVVGVAPPTPIETMVALERGEPFGNQAVAGRGPFDIGRRGIFAGEAAVAIVLERGETARRRGVDMLAELAACETLSAASRESALDGVIKMVYGQTEQRPGVWWSCGAGSAKIDAEECKIVGPQVGAPVTSSKGSIGNPDECAGLIDVVLAVAALRRRQVPPIGLLAAPDPALGRLDFVIGSARELAGLECALVTAVGLGPNATAGAALLARGAGA